jgi:diguanylate cyclase (GGDEF)-like protein/PAS domain S-box-containing protein
MTSHHESLLVVDDNKQNRDMLCRRLTREGFKTTAAEGGTPALECIARQKYDLVLLDIVMPDISGLEVLKLIRQAYSPMELPVIMATGHQQSEEVVEALNLGANDYVTKPLDFPVVLARIGTQLSRKQTDDALREREERYALAVRGTHNGLWDWNLTTNVVYFSPQWKAILGCEEDNVENKLDSWFNRVHPEDLKRVSEAIDAHRKGLTSHFESEHRMLHEDGTYRWMLGRALAVRNGEGETYRMAGSITDITENKMADPLTGLPNRILFLDRLGQAVERAKRRKDYLFAVLFLDLDRFKVVNESLGHAVGDQLLLAISQRLKTHLRSVDTIARPKKTNTIARLGGDEFAILLEDIKHVSDVTRVTDRIHKELMTAFSLNGHEVYTSASIGIAMSATGYDHAEDMLRDADTAMYRAKAAGNGRYELFDSTMHAGAVARLQLETDLRRAVERRQFVVHYQPIVSLATGKIKGFEALARWLHPQRGLLLPAEFIPTAEEMGLIIPMGESILREALRQTRLWQTRYSRDPPLEISVNLSVRQFTQSDLIEHIGQILQKNRLDPATVRLEVTESVLIDDADSANTILQQVHSLGVRLGIDDFGTGYSSLSHLHLFPFDTLKIDRSFIGRIGKSGHSSEIVRTMVTLAHNLGLDVVAEGVETTEQMAHLRELGCEFGQGFLFSKAVDSEAAGALIAADPQW